MKNAGGHFCHHFTDGEIEWNDALCAHIHRGIPTPKQIHSLVGNSCTDY